MELKNFELVHLNNIKDQFDMETSFEVFKENINPTQSFGFKQASTLPPTNHLEDLDIPTIKKDSTSSDKSCTESLPHSATKDSL